MSICCVHVPIFAHPARFTFSENPKSKTRGRALYKQRLLDGKTLQGLGKFVLKVA
jgi:hypothetical protein